MAARPTPPRSDIDTTRALNAASRHRPKATGDGRVVLLYGRSVHHATPNRPYGRSTHARGYLTHIATRMYVAWMTGRHVGHMVWWRCGGSTQHFVLLAEPNSPLCPVCVAYSYGRDNLRQLPNGAS